LTPLTPRAAKAARDVARQRTAERNGVENEMFVVDSGVSAPAGGRPTGDSAHVIAQYVR
jgi:hypothetical protein